MRWRRIDLKRVIAERFCVDFHARYVGKLLKTLGFSHISARPRHPAQDERIVEAFKKTCRRPRPACGGRNGVAILIAGGSGRGISGGGNPRQKTWPMGCCALESGDAITAIPVRKLISLRGSALRFDREEAS